MTYKHRLQSGFTLIEMVMAMALLSIFLLILTDLFAAVVDVQTSSQASSAVSVDGRYIMQRLGHDVGRSTSVTTPNTLGGSSATLTVVVGGTNHTYAVTGGNLQLTNSLGTNRLNSTGTTVSAVTFRRLGEAGGRDTIRMTFTLTSTTQRNSGAEVETFTITTGRRP